MTTSDEDSNELQLNPVQALMMQTLDLALEACDPVAKVRVRKIRDAYHQDTPAQVAKKLQRRYLATVAGSGASTGAAAVAPVPGLGIPAALVDTTAYIRETVIYTLALADVYGIEVETVEQRRVLVTMILLGGAGVKGAAKVTGVAAPNIARHIVKAVPARTLRQINLVLGRNFVTKYGTKQGVVVLSKQVPLGIGAVLGGGANAGFGYATVRAARKSFGTPPSQWPTDYDLAA